MVLLNGKASERRQRPSRRWRLVFLAGWTSAVLVVALVSVVGAETSPSLSTQALAAKVDHHYNALHSLRVNFVQQYDGMGMHRQESGVLLLKKPGRMRWNYSQPPGKLFVLDGKDAYFYSPGASEVQRVSAKKLDDLRSPLQLLLGHTQLAKELTNLQMTPAGDAFQLSGTPKGMEQRIASFQLTVTPDGTILGIKIEETDGSTTRFSFTGEQPNVPASDADFVFKAPPGVSIVNGLPPV
jgi:outer membrane lipoprotein carrier protein